MVARNNNILTERKISAWVLGFFCFVFKISALTIINILRTTKADSVVQLHGLRWVKSMAPKHRVFEQCHPAFLADKATGGDSMV